MISKIPRVRQIQRSGSLNSGVLTQYMVVPPSKLKHSYCSPSGGKVQVHSISLYYYVDAPIHLVMAS